MSDMTPISTPGAVDPDAEKTRRPISFEELHAQAAAAHEDVEETVEPEGPRKPRVALMGEFSAGKSTLTNLLMGCRPLPERVTATRLSPVWISQGSGGPRRVCLDGREEPVGVNDIDGVPIEGTRMIRLFLEHPPILEYCDLIDFPGISDPNMESEVWERLLPDVDMILWCTHATQAWRQSEAAVWEMVPDRVRAKSLLVVTRFDKLTTERDRSRVLNRLTHEAGGMFAGVYPIALLQALAAGQTDVEAWTASGAGPFADKLIDTLKGFGAITDGEDGDASAEDTAPVGEDADVVAAPVAEGPRIMPRRVRPRAAGLRRPRPSAEEGDASLTPRPAPGTGAIDPFDM